VTTNRGTGDPTTASGAHADARADTRNDARPASPNGSNSAQQGQAPEGNGSGQTSTAYEVAAALRAQASRAAQVTRDAASRVQSAVKVGDSDAKADNGTATETDAAAEPTGAAAAIAATAPKRPGNQTSDKPKRGKAQRSRANRTAPASNPNPTRSEPSPEPPPEVAAAAPVVPPAPVAPKPVVVPEPQPRRGHFEGDETQVSLDARPELPRQDSHPHRIPQPAPMPVRRGSRVRKARLRLMRVDPWSVMKTAFLLSVALGIAMFVAVAVLWSVLDAAGVFTAVGDLVRDLTASEASAGVDVEAYTSLSRVLGFTTLIAVVDVVLVTALATLGAFLYNLSAGLLGGLELTLAEDD
jgi:hypothetical protein